MRQQVNIICEDESEIEINFNCDEKPESRNRITFRLHAPTPIASSSRPSNPAPPTKTMPDVSDESVEFVIKVWKYKGYLIVQYGENDFSIYRKDGQFVDSATSLDEAQDFIEDYIKQEPTSNPPRM